MPVFNFYLSSVCPYLHNLAAIAPTEAEALELIAYTLAQQGHIVRIEKADKQGECQ